MIPLLDASHAGLSHGSRPLPVECVQSPCGSPFLRRSATVGVISDRTHPGGGVEVRDPNDG